MKAFKMMKELFGGFDEVGATSVDCKNFRRGINLFIREYDVKMVVELLMNKQEYINGFSCDYFTNDDGNIFGLFWADEVAKHNYLSFDDVISFDATFRSNKYKMVFVPFTGIDNLHRSVTFAVALLSNETAESYGWLLRAFKKAFGREPMVVVTDSNEDSCRKGVLQFKTSILLPVWGLPVTFPRPPLHMYLVGHVRSEFPKRYVSRRWTRDAVTREKLIVFDGRNKFSEESIRDEIVKDIIGSVEYCIDKLASNIEELAKF
ncbi:FAR1-related sequence 5-like protein [Tanacetum coccineum]